MTNNLNSQGQGQSMTKEAQVVKSEQNKTPDKQSGMKLWNSKFVEIELLIYWATKLDKILKFLKTIYSFFEGFYNLLKYNPYLPIWPSYVK